ncbi:MAG: hypothetical protein HY719_10720 [Planctomycetes bacterium]|nr:hypothetical protein [Planctomycetota bacterium]
MNILGKVFAVLVFALSLVYTGVSATNLAMEDNYKNRFLREAVTRVAYHDQASNLAAKYTAAMRHYSNVDRTVREQIARHVEAKKIAIHHAQNLMAQYMTLSQDIAKTQVDVGRIQTSVSNFEGTATRLSDENRKTLKYWLQALRERDAVRVTNATMRKSYAQAVEDYDQLQSTFWVKSRELDEARSEIQMLRAASPDIDQKVATGIGRKLAARVHAVDEEVGLVILSVGQTDRVVIGQKFAVYRDDRFKANVKVERVYPNTCAATIVWDTAIRRIEVGDDALASGSE